MAKRKRLGPVDAFAAAPAPETKSALSQPPIASVAGDAAAADALARVSTALETARAEGRLVQKIPLDQVAADHLIRDRIGADTTEMEALKESLRNRGQQTPIEVVELDQGRFGLISGWRRLHALRALAEDGGTDTVLARLIIPGTEAEAYVAMVEENEIRVGLSYYERARIVLRAEQEGVYSSRKAALQGLFANVSRAKRSKIGSFVTVVEALDGVLRFPTHLGERLGLQLAKAIEDGRTEDLCDVLGNETADAAQEQERLRRVLGAPDINTVSRPKPHRPKPVKTAALQGDIEINEAEGEIRLSGSGVTDAFKAALKAWVAKRD